MRMFTEERRAQRREALQIAGDEAASADTLRWVYREARSPKALELLASNLNTPADVLAKLADSFPARVACNPNTPADVILGIKRPFNGRFRSDLLEAASSLDTPADVLTNITYIEHWRLGRGVARNPNTPPDALRFLLNHRNVDVRAAAAMHPNAPGDALHACALRKSIGSAKEISAVAHNPNTWTDTLAELISARRALEWRFHGDDAIKGIASHPNTPPDFLKRLATSSGYPELRALALSNPSCPPIR